MKKIHNIKWVLLAFIAFQFTACENEALVGEFPEEEEIINPAEEGQFLATIAGEEFVAESSGGVMTPENKLIISGIKSSSGQEITLVVNNAAVGNFTLTYGTGSSNMATYKDDTINPFLWKSVDSIGGSGLMRISEIDTDSLTVSGTFSFIGGRQKVDVDGNPIVDINGDPVIENIEVTAGAFNSIPYVLDEEGGGGTGGGDPQEDFFAKVDGIDFIVDSLSVTEPIIGDVHMIKIEARDSLGALIRIDVPRNLGVGTFPMENISDGTKLIALYNAGGGGENLTSNPGSINITEFDLELGVLEATFSFTGTDPLGGDPTIVEITEGSFTVFFVGVPGANNVFTAKVDGTTYAPETVTVTQSVLNGIPNLTLSTTVGEQTMSLTFPLIISEGTFEMSPVFELGNEIMGQYRPTSTSITYVSDPGTFIITNYDIAEGIIEGTFEFTAVDGSGQDETEYAITEGVFLAVIE